MFISADGETGKGIWQRDHQGGASQWNDEYTVTIRLPAPFAHLSNTPGRTPTYRLSAPVQWHHLAGRVGHRRPVPTGRSDTHIRFDADRERWYITASWSQPPKKSPGVKEAARSGRCLAIDRQLGTCGRTHFGCSRQPGGSSHQKEHPREGLLSSPSRCAERSGEPTRQVGTTAGCDGDSHREARLHRHPYQTERTERQGR